MINIITEKKAIEKPITTTIITTPIKRMIIITTTTATNTTTTVTATGTTTPDSIEWSHMNKKKSLQFNDNNKCNSLLSTMTVTFREWHFPNATN